MLTASSEPCIGTDGQVVPDFRENRTFSQAEQTYCQIDALRSGLTRLHTKIRLRNVVPPGNLAFDRPSLGAYLGNVG